LSYAFSAENGPESVFPQSSGVSILIAVRQLLKHVPPRQVLLYLASGVFANVFVLVLYWTMLRLNVWYLAASVIGDIVGIITSFTLHKYVVFAKKDRVVEHFARYLTVELGNTVASNTILYVIVGVIGVQPAIAKIFAMGSVVFWNFFLYKFFVYV
jgi:putative flippase GtrA